MGAWVATTMAIRYPELVSAVVAVDGGLRLVPPRGLDDEEAVEAVVGPSVSGLAMRFASPNEYTAHWEAHPAIAPYLPDVATPNAQYSLTGEEPELQVRANRMAVTQDGTEFLLDEEVITAAQKVSQPMTLITVDHGLLDRPGGFMSTEAVEEATSVNPNITVRALRDTNHYTLMLGQSAPQVAAAIEEAIASVAT
jgi:pimeloyl-ACP methyl ester carboxylesterase